MSLDPKEKHPISKVISHTQTNLICCGHDSGAISLFDFSANKITHSLPQAHSTCTSSLALSSTGLQLISGSHDGSIKVWDLRKLGAGKNEPLCSVEKAHLAKYDEAVMGLATQSSGKSPLLVSTGADSVVKIYEMFL